jgi:Tol biopolymer transport system component
MGAFCLTCLCLCTLLLSSCVQPLPPSASTAGQLAYIGSDGNVYVTDPNGWGKQAITTDATVAAEGNGRSYHRLAWSPDGQLAFAAVERGLNQTRSQVYVATPGQPAQRVGQSERHFVIYLSWSPQGCQQPATCHLAYLIEGEEKIDLRLVAIQPDGTNNQVIGAGRPFYFAWSPDGQQMLWHTDGARQSDAAAALTRYPLATQQSAILPVAPGFFLAPAWSPDGASWLDVVAAPGQGAILRRVLTSTGEAETIATNQFDIAFAWSPDGRQVAYAARGYGTDPFLGPIHLYEVATQTSRRLTDVGLHVQAFFWSPDSQRIGYINWLAVPNEHWAQWRVYDVARSQDRGFKAFVPTHPMRLIIGSFNQFAQSHALWSPDGRYLLYADRDRQLVERIWLIDTWAAQQRDPLLVSEGSLGVWSWPFGNNQATNPLL